MGEDCGTLFVCFFVIVDTLVIKIRRCCLYVDGVIVLVFCDSISRVWVLSVVLSMDYLDCT